LPFLQAYFNQYQDTVYRIDMSRLLWSLFGFVFTALLAKGFTVWILEIEYKQQLEKTNLESNLALLKARINPHFLFNTLNNIDVLIEKDAAAASTYLKKLSDILRFTLYESPSEIIPLSKEAEYIRQYIELQQIRTSNADFVKFSFDTDTDNLQIAPMLFIPFIENAFKYSSNKKIKHAVIINLSTKQNKAMFTCSNAYDASTKVQYEESSGLGLALIKSRLELLYPKNYKLDISKTTDRFNVNLSITLHDDKLPDN
jgi:LytS/YehU family sensor histidine kinase